MLQKESLPLCHFAPLRPMPFALRPESAWRFPANLSGCSVISGLNNSRDERFFNLFFLRWPKVGSRWPLYIVRGDNFSLKTCCQYEHKTFSESFGCISSI